MDKEKNNLETRIIVKGNKIDILKIGNINYISLTDLAKKEDKNDPSGLIKQWMSNKDSFDYYGLWEELNNPNFNSVEFHLIKNNVSGRNRFLMNPTKWKKITNAIGIIPSSGKYSIGTFAHPDIAFEFASWLSPEFKLYLIKEFERLKEKESYEKQIDWQATRILSKANYIVHTETIKEYIVPTLTESQKKHIYSDEADILNVALFGMTAGEWRETNRNLKGNIRDYADLLHLIILNNLETINSELVKMGLNQFDRLIKLNESAQKQMEILKNNKNIKDIEKIQNNSKYLSN